MATNHDHETEHGHGEHHSEAYSSTKEAFDELPLEEKARFLFESTMKTVVDAVREVADQVGDAVKEACEDIESEDDDEIVVEEEEAEAESKPKKKAAKKTTTKKKSATKKKSDDSSDDG